MLSSAPLNLRRICGRNRFPEIVKTGTYSDGYLLNSTLWRIGLKPIVSIVVLKAIVLDNLNVFNAYYLASIHKKLFLQNM